MKNHRTSEWYADKRRGVFKRKNHKTSECYYSKAPGNKQQKPLNPKIETIHGIQRSTPHVIVDLSDEHLEEFINTFYGRCRKFNYTSQECYYKDKPKKGKNQVSKKPTPQINHQKESHDDDQAFYDKWPLKTNSRPSFAQNQQQKSKPVNKIRKLGFKNNSKLKR